MADCAACPLFELESGQGACLHVNRPGGLDLTRDALGLCDLPPGARMLEVAAGAGTTLDYLDGQAGLDAVGLDISAAMLSLGKSRRPQSRLLQADCRQIPLESGSRQAVMMECALSLAGGLEAALSEFRRVLAPGGKLILTDIYVREPKDPAARRCLANTRCLSGALTEDELRCRVAEGGFQIKEWQDRTAALKQWLAGMVFRLGSLAAFYRRLADCEAGAEALCRSLGSEIKLGYYLMAAEKC